MKKLLLHIALISYAAVVLFKPLLPHISDFVNHLLFYSKHMATVHYEQGAYHVHFEAAGNVAEETSSLPNTPAAKKDFSFTDHCFFWVDDEPVFGNTLHRNKMDYNDGNVLKGSPDKQYPPPRI